MIAMLLFLILNTTGKYYYILLSYDLGTILFFILNALEKFYPNENDPKY